MNTNIDSFEDYHEANQKILMKSIGIDLDDLVTGGFSSVKCKYLRIQLILIEIFKFYNVQKNYCQEGSELNEELLCLSEFIWKIDDDKSENIHFKSLLKILGLSILIKVYFDVGYNLICERLSSNFENLSPLDWLHI